MKKNPINEKRRFFVVFIPLMIYNLKLFGVNSSFKVNVFGQELIMKEI
jgi:hypothetical protein